MNLKLEDKRALASGGSRGRGKITASPLAQLGAAVKNDAMAARGQGAEIHPR